MALNTNNVIRSFDQIFNTLEQELKQVDGAIAALTKEFQNEPKVTPEEIEQLKTKLKEKEDEIKRNYEEIISLRNQINQTNQTEN